METFELWHFIFILLYISRACNPMYSFSHFNKVDIIISGKSCLFLSFSYLHGLVASRKLKPNISYTALLSLGNIKPASPTRLRCLLVNNRLGTLLCGTVKLPPTGRSICKCNGQVAWVSAQSSEKHHNSYTANLFNLTIIEK